MSRRKFVAGTVGGVAVGAAVGLAGGYLGGPTKTTTETTTLPAVTSTTTLPAVTNTSTVTSTTATTAQPWLPSKWDYTADIVVIGYGGAGAITAITAFDAGASVLILEKTPSLASLGLTGGTIRGGGGLTHMNMGAVVTPSDANLASQHLYALSWGSTPPAVCQAWGQGGTQVRAWLTKMGVPYTTAAANPDYPTLPGASSIESASITGGGAVLFAALDNAIQSRNIPVLFNTPATDLIQNANTKEIVGVKALSLPTPSASSTSVWYPQMSAGTQMNIRANKAVVLCTAGFEYNDTMKLNFLRSYPAHFMGWIYDTGDGITMAQKVGAGLWHMNAISARALQWFPDNDIAWGGSQPSNGYIYVDIFGHRFTNETSTAFTHSGAYTLSEVNIDLPAYSRVPLLMIFDETTRKSGQLASTSTYAYSASIPIQLGGTTKWSSDNSAEIAKGYILQANTIMDLAAAINAKPVVMSNSHDAIQTAPVTLNIDPAVLDATVTKYNSYCTAKTDPDFRRAAATLLPIVTPPFYAMPRFPGGPNTQGGPIRNENAQVCDPDGNAIPRLYSNGELGSIYGFLYPRAGGNNCEMIVFGQIAGNKAASEKPWS